MISWKWPKSMSELHSIAFKEFLDKFFDGRHTSLLVLGTNPTGDRHWVNVTASEDAEMYRLAKARIEELAFTRFVAFGEGRMPTAESGVVDIFIMYFQDVHDATVQSAVMPYRRDGEAIRCSDWHRNNLIDDSWTLPEYHQPATLGLRDRLGRMFRR